MSGLRIPEDAERRLWLACETNALSTMVSVNADDLRAVLVGLAAMPARESLAKAWSEGMNLGSSRAMRHMSDEPNLPLASEEDNPYLDLPVPVLDLNAADPAAEAERYARAVEAWSRKKSP